MKSTVSLSKWAFSFFILLLFLSLNKGINPSKSVYSSSSTKENNMIVFKEIVEKCQQLLPKKEKFEGVLVIEVDLDPSSKKDNALSWTCLLVTSIDNNFKHYKFKKTSTKKITYEESEMAFGYTPFQSIDLELKAALHLINNQNKSTCQSGRLYFPLSPFDTEPIWLFTFEDRKSFFVGANTGKIELVK